MSIFMRAESLFSRVRGEARAIFPLVDTEGLGFRFYQQAWHTLISFYFDF